MGFGPKDERINLTKSQLKEQMQFVGLDKVKRIEYKVVKESAEIYLDFNSIAKGFGVDAIARFLDSKIIGNYLIEIGGEIRTSGFKKKPTTLDYKISRPYSCR